MAITEAPIADIPLYNEELMSGEAFPAPVEKLRGALRAADAILFVSPEYNYSIPGTLKNAIDWASRGKDQPFSGKPAAIMGASPGRLGSARMQYHLRQTLVFLDCHPLNKPEVMVTGAMRELGPDAVPSDATRAVISAQLDALAAWTNQLR
jgi:chromate reductase